MFAFVRLSEHQVMTVVKRMSAGENPIVNGVSNSDGSSSFPIVGEKQ
jgi:hypothetical protein